MLKVGADFKVGEKVVYPAHGVGVIESLQVRNVSGTQAHRERPLAEVAGTLRSKAR